MLSVILCPTEIRSGEEDLADLQPHTVHFRLLSDFLHTSTGPIDDSRTPSVTVFLVYSSCSVGE